MTSSSDLLAFEARGWRFAGPKEQAIVAELGLTVTGYYQRLLQAAVDPVAVAAFPGVAARVRRLAAPRGRSVARWSA